MVLSTVRVEDFERFWNTFSTKGAEKRKQHGSKGSQVFRDPNDDNRVWVVFDWDEEGYKNLLSDPEMPASSKRRGSKAGLRRRSSRVTKTPSSKHPLPGAQHRCPSTTSHFCRDIRNGGSVAADRSTATREGSDD